MTPLPFVWPHGLLFWAATLWAFWPEMRLLRRAERGNPKDAKSLQLIMGGMGLAQMAAFPLAFVDALQFKQYRLAAYLLGIGVTIAGSLLRRHCFRMLGSSFTGDVRASADQQIVTRGAYSILRHPSYTAGTLLNTGQGIALGSWGSVLLLSIASLAVYAYRMKVEERALLAAIGEPYRQFMSTRKRIIPFIY